MKNLLKKNFFHELRNPIGKLGNSKNNSLSFNNSIRITDKSQNSNEIYKTMKNLKEKYNFLNQPYLASLSNENNKYKKISTLENENLLSSRIESIINSNLNEAFFVYDPSSVINQYKKWKKLLPRFETFYAIKCNNDPNILETMKHLNMSYDCASLEEIKTALKNGTDPEKIIFANPCKQINHIKYAYQMGVNKMTFDNADEIYKIKDFHPNAELIIRIKVDDSKSLCQLGDKFGVSKGKSKELLLLAKHLGMKVVGVSFHVGSGCTDSSSYSDALIQARSVFEEADEIGYNLSILDIGGGFPTGNADEELVKFEDIAEVINRSLDENFEKWLPKLQLIAEPGRFFAANAYTLATKITSRRLIDEDNRCMLYINDGVYGSFNNLLFDHANLPKPEIYLKNKESQNVNYSPESTNEKKNLINCSIWGPTCDSIDCISKSIMLPLLNVEDWLIFRNMGAYTLVAASNFNGMNLPIVYILDKDILVERFTLS